MKRVLSVGNCGFDHRSISQMIEGKFDATVTACDTHDAALTSLREQGADLVLVNRIFDRDGAEGLSLIKDIKADPNLAPTPVMMITNFPEHQERATAEGAAEGFGKADLNDPQTLAKVSKVLEG